MNRLRYYREKAKLTQEQLQERCGCVSQSAISKHELGSKYITDLHKLSAIARILDCQTHELIESNIHTEPHHLLDHLLAWLESSKMEPRDKEHIQDLVSIIRKHLPKE